MLADDVVFAELAELPELGDLSEGVEFAPERKPTPDPLAGVEYTGSVEADSKAEVSALLQGFRDRAKAEQKRFDLATDSEYWVALCFQAREQKEQFLRALDLIKHGGKYLDGRVVAKKLGVTLNDDVTVSKLPRIDPKLAALAR